MSRWRIAVVAFLLIVPFLVLSVVGSYYLWTTGWGFVVWWPLTALVALGYLLAWYWQHKRQLLAPPEAAPPVHWTERDKQAWKLVEARARDVDKLDPDRLGSINFYTDLAQEMARELAQFYHPKSQDPLGPLTIPEILAVVELAAHDLAELVENSLPAGHLLTIQDWRRARQLTEWYRAASNTYWLVSALFSPIETGVRYAAARFGVGKSWEMFQQNLLVWFYTHYVHRLGKYLIELNSGRLRVGARRYRELMRKAENPELARRASEGDPRSRVGLTTDSALDEPPRVTITLLGQVKAGKSSLVNALLGEQRARTDVIACTDEISRYELQQDDIPTKLVVLDTVGYGHEGPKEDQLKKTQEAAQQSELLLLVLHARNPAREADRVLLEKLRGWFAERTHLKMPPILAVLTHIDLLTPAMEWSPPYDWRNPTRPKEREISEAAAAVRQQLGQYLADVVPVCVAPGKVYGIDEWLLPELAGRLDEAHAVGLLRCLKAEADAGKVRRLVRQLLTAGRQAAKLWSETRPG